MRLQRSDVSHDDRNKIRAILWASEGSFDGEWRPLTDPPFWLEVQFGRWRLPVAPRLDGS